VHPNFVALVIPPSLKQRGSFDNDDFDSLLPHTLKLHSQKQDPDVEVRSEGKSVGIELLQAMAQILGAHNLKLIIVDVGKV
jgi:hypothetical protein